MTEGERAVRLWEFVRGDLAPAAFEPWLYAEAALEADLGPALHLAALSTDFRSEESVGSLRQALAEHLRRRHPGPCLCRRLRDLDVVDMGTFYAPPPAFEQDRAWTHQDVLGPWQRVAERGPPWWWLWAARCAACGQAWLVGSEERQNDLFCVKRLGADALELLLRGGPWPGDLDAYETLLRVGAEAGRRVAFVDPDGSSLRATMADLARARPGITVAELAALLALDAATAERLARAAVAAEGVDIRLPPR